MISTLWKGLQATLASNPDPGGGGGGGGGCLSSIAIRDMPRAGSPFSAKIPKLG